MSKLINVADDVYQRLSTLKKREESFSEVLRELLKKKTNKEKILSFAGLEGMDENKIKSLKEGWKKWSSTHA